MIQSGDTRELAALRAGDEPAWATLFDSHYPKVYRSLRSREAAEALASEVFLEAFRSIAHFELRGRLLAVWLFGIAGHVLASHYRVRARMPADTTAEYPGAPRDLDRARYRVVRERGAQLLFGLRGRLLRKRERAAGEEVCSDQADSRSVLRWQCHGCRPD